jgi:hypothetical protein
MIDLHLEYITFSLMTVYPCFEDEANTQLTKYKIIKGMGKEVPNILVTVRILLWMDVFMHKIFVQHTLSKKSTTVPGTVHRSVSLIFFETEK